MELKFGLNKTFLITSLRGNHKESAEDLYRLHICRFFHQFAPIMVEVNSRKEFEEELSNIYNSLQEGEFPLIHIEAHGLVNKNGLSLANNDEILWNEMRPAFTRINNKSCNNLMLVISACNSQTIIDELVNAFGEEIDSRAPFLGFVGTKGIIDVDYLITGFPIFYEELANSLSLSESVRKMNNATLNQFTFDECFHVCKHGMEVIANTWIKERIMKIMMNPSLLTNFYCKLFEYTYNKPCTLDAIIKIFWSEKFYIDFLNKRRNDFLGVTDCPEYNTGRFGQINSLPNFEKSTKGLRMIRRQ